MSYTLNMKKRIYQNFRGGGLVYEAFLEKFIDFPDLPQQNLAIIISHNDFFIIEDLAYDMNTNKYYANQSIKMPHYHRSELNESVQIHIENGWELTGESSVGE